MSLEARLWALRLGFEPQGQDLGLETRIWASRGGGRKRRMRRRRRRNFPICVKAYLIGPFRAAAQKVVIILIMLSTMDRNK